MNSSRVIIFSQRLNIECSKQQNEYFLHQYSEKEKNEIQKQWGFFSIKPEISKKPRKVADNKLIHQNELSNASKAVYYYANAREKAGLHDTVSKQVAENLVLSADLNAHDLYQPHCVLKLSFETNVKNQIDSVRRFDIQFHYQIKKNGKILGLNAETGKLEELGEQDALKMQKAIEDIEKKLSTDNEYQAMKERIAREPLSAAGKEIKEIIKKEYSPISFACSTRILTVARQDSKLPLDIFDKSPNLSQIKTEDSYLNKHCVYERQTDFILGMNTDDVKIRAELIERNEKSFVRSENADKDEVVDISYRLRNTNVLPANEPTESTSDYSCGCFDWLKELMSYIGKLIEDAILAMLPGEEEVPRNRFDM